MLREALRIHNLNPAFFVPEIARTKFTLAVVLKEQASKLDGQEAAPAKKMEKQIESEALRHEALDLRATLLGSKPEKLGPQDVQESDFDKLVVFSSR